MWEDIKAILEDDQGIDWSEGEPVLLPHEQLRGLLADAEALLRLARAVKELGMIWAASALADGGDETTPEECWQDFLAPMLTEAYNALPAPLREQREG